MSYPVHLSGTKTCGNTTKGIWQSIYIFFEFPKRSQKYLQCRCGKLRFIQHQFKINIFFYVVGNIPRTRDKNQGHVIRDILVDSSRKVKSEKL